MGDNIMVLKVYEILFNIIVQWTATRSYDSIGKVKNTIQPKELEKTVHRAMKDSIKHVGYCITEDKEKRKYKKFEVNYNSHPFRFIPSLIDIIDAKNVKEEILEDFEIVELYTEVLYTLYQTDRGLRYEILKKVAETFKLYLKRNLRVAENIIDVLNDDPNQTVKHKSIKIEGKRTEYIYLDDDEVDLELKRKLLSLNQDDRHLPECMVNYFQLMYKDIRTLTKEQYTANRAIAKKDRFLVTGPAGSGKSVMAAYLANTQSEGGYKTLILFRNPFLINYFNAMTSGIDAEIIDFITFVKNNMSVDSNIMKWNHYLDLTSEELIHALCYIDDMDKSKMGKYSLVIVDEAQDFESEWWDIVEAFVEICGAKLIVFKDDFQDLYIQDKDFPYFENRIRLTKNCRNGGEIVKFINSIKSVHLCSADELDDIGKYYYSSFSNEPEALKMKLGESIARAYELGHEDITILTTSDENPYNLELNNSRIYVPLYKNGWEDNLRTAISELEDFYNSKKWIIHRFEKSKKRLQEFSSIDIFTLDCRFFSEISDSQRNELDHFISEYFKFVNFIRYYYNIIENEKEPSKRSKEYYIASYVCDLNDEFESICVLVNKLSPENLDSFLKEKAVFKVEVDAKTEYFHGCKKVKVSTVYSYKGLESDAIILIISSHSSISDTLLYIASSRAHSYFEILHNKAVNIDSRTYRKLMTIPESE